MRILSARVAALKWFLFFATLPILLSLQGCVTPVVIGADELGVKLNTFTGKMTVLENSGTYMQKWYIEVIYLLKKSEFNVEFTSTEGRGEARGKDDIRVKTFDGSDVFLDVSFTYKIDIANAVNFVRYSGADDDGDINDKWIRPFARSRIREELGRLSTEQFYDSVLRQKHAEMTRVKLNEDLNKHGLIVTNVNIQDFRFYTKYEEKIKQKKAADQSVEQQKSARKAAIEDQKKQKMSAQKKVEVQIAEFKGKTNKDLLGAEARAAERITQSQSYAYARKQEADAILYESKNQAKQIFELGKAETESLKCQVEAMEGKGGKNLVRLEYAKKLKNLAISGEPWSFSPEVSSLGLKQLPAGVTARPQSVPPREPPPPSKPEEE